jgi:hypothetical protein
MDNDTKLIFEAYAINRAKVLAEAPISADDIGYTGSFKSAPGKGYGLGQAASTEGKDIDEIAKRLLPKIKELFQQQTHDVGGKTYNLYYPGSDDKFKSELIPLIQNELKINKTLAGYTARIVNNLLNVVRSVDPSKSQGVSTTKDVEIATIKGLENKPVAPVAEKPTVKAIKGDTELEIHKDTPLEDKKLKQLVYNLDEEPMTAKEWIAEIKLKKDQYNDEHEDEKISDLAPDILSTLINTGVLKQTAAAKAEKEGEGSGEIETIEDYPEGDDVYSTAKQEFRLRDIPGDRNYGDFS